jgi:hypothetical protein
MFKVSLRRPVRGPIKLAGRCAVAGLLLLVAACAAAGSADDPDNAKNHGFYGSVIGGGVPPP